MFPAQKLTRGPATAGPFFMFLERLTAYTVGRFSFPIPATIATPRHVSAYTSAAVCVQPMEPPAPEQRSTPGTTRHAIGVCRAILAPFYRPWHCYHTHVFTPVFGALQRPTRAYPPRPVSAYIAARYAKTPAIAPKLRTLKAGDRQPVCAMARSREPENPIVRAKVVKASAPDQFFLP